MKETGGGVDGNSMHLAHQLLSTFSMPDMHHVLNLNALH